MNSKISESVVSTLWIPRIYSQWGYSQLDGHGQTCVLHSCCFHTWKNGIDSLFFKSLWLENLTKGGFNGRKVYLSTTGRYNTSLQGGGRLLVHISVDQAAEKGAAGDWQVSFFPLTTDSASTAHDIIRFRQVLPTWLILSGNSRTVLYQCHKCFLI